MTSRAGLLGLFLSAACAGRGDESSDGPAGPRACTEIGCIDGLSVTVRTASGTFPVGLHSLEVTMDGTKESCTFELSTEFEAHPCSAGVDVYLDQRRMCATVMGARKCTLVPGQYEERITVQGIHQRVRLLQRTGDRVIVDRELTPTYLETRPNGPGCPPVCRTASAEWDLPAT